MGVHVFGNPCDIEAIERIAQKNNLKVIYDGAHAFGVTYKDKSIFSYGDVSACSFHATKLFHTIEGGGIFAKDEAVSSRIELAKRFGHNYDEHLLLGINAKASEFQAAMGLVNMNHINEIIAQRERIFELYNRFLDSRFGKLTLREGATPNYAYYPIVLSSEDELKGIVDRLAKQNIHPRRYFYPSLNKLPYLRSTTDCPIAEDIARRVLCLPLYNGLKEKDIIRISRIINE